MMNLSRVTLIPFILCALLANSSLAQDSVKEELPKTKIEIFEAIKQHIDSIRSYIHDSRETNKAKKAIDAERKSIGVGKTKNVEIITTGGPLMAGGTFVKIQEVSTGPKLSEPDTHYSQPITIGGGLPSLSELTPEQKKEMKKRAEDALRAEKVLKDAAETEKKLKEVREAAEKAREELEAKEAVKRKSDLAAKAAAEEQARIAKEIEHKRQDDIRIAAEKARAELEASQVAAAAAAQAAKAAAAAREQAAREAAQARKGAVDAERNGREVMREIQRERNRYKAEGGPFRAPAGGGAN